MDSAKLVLNVEAAGASEVRAMDRHERAREPDGVSAIDPLRSHLNQVLHGPSGPSAALNAIWAAGMQRPNKQAEKPYLRLVIGASPSYFRDPGEGPGTWNADRLADFQREVLAWMRQRFGDDLAFASLHLDEDTPHIHALIVPTYERKPRTPGKRKRGETLEQFEARKTVAKAAVGVRTVGRSSHPVLSRRGSFDTMRHSLADHLAPLGIVYGDPLQPDESAKTTRQWVKEEAAKVAADRAALEADQAALEADRAALEADQAALEADQAALEADRTALEADRKAMAFDRANLEAEQKAMAIERKAMASDRDHLHGLVQSLEALIQRAQVALKSFLRLTPRVRRIIRDAEASAEERQAALEARSEIVKAVPPLRSTGSFLSDARRASLRSALEQAREPVSLDYGLDFDGPG